MKALARTAVLGALLTGIAITAPAFAYADTAPPAAPSPVVAHNGFSPVAGDIATLHDLTSATSAVSPVCLPCLHPATPPAPSAPAAPARPFLFTYTFVGELKVGGGDFTLGGTVDVDVRYTNGALQARHTLIAHTHPVTPGGAVYVGTGLIADCPGPPDGYIQAYDETTRISTTPLPITICAPPTGGLGASVR